MDILNVFDEIIENNLIANKEIPKEEKLTFNISQSLIKMITNKKGAVKKYCPLFIKECILDKSKTTVPSLNMLKGSYFEYLALGKNAYDIVTDLPRALRPFGEKTLAQIRIEKQVNNFKELANNLSIELIDDNIQVYIKTKYEYANKDIDIYITGNIDLISNITNHNISNNYVIDLKLTKDVYNTFTEFGWGNVENLDHIQMTIYNFLTGLKTLYWVFDYSPQLNNEIFEYPVDATDIDLMHTRIKTTINELIFAHNSDYKIIPNFDNCNLCPNNPKHGGKCSNAEIIKPIKNIY